MQNLCEVSFLAISDNEAFARMVAAAFIMPLNPTMEQLSDIKTAISEAVTNAIIHGYAERKGIVKMRCQIIDQELIIEISDNGQGIENIQLAKQPLYTTKPNLERSGMGFTIMESFMDEVEIESIVGMGTKVTMKKKIKNNNEIENELQFASSCN